LFGFNGYAHASVHGFSDDIIPGRWGSYGVYVPDPFLRMRVIDVLGVETWREWARLLHFEPWQQPVEVKDVELDLLGYLAGFGGC